MPKRAPLETKDRLLHAATEFIATSGAANLTLDAVAAAAGISKGGLLHHFPTKHALLRGVIGQVATFFKARLERALEMEPEGASGRWTRAYITASFASDPDELQLTNAIASIVTGDPALLHVFKEDFAWMDAQLERDGLPLARAMVIRLACDGLWVAEVVDSAPVGEPLRAALRDELIGLTR
jgi:AcrR family transcriptional regulator